MRARAGLGLVFIASLAAVFLLFPFRVKAAPQYGGPGRGFANGGATCTVYQDPDDDRMEAVSGTPILWHTFTTPVSTTVWPQMYHPWERGHIAWSMICTGKLWVPADGGYRFYTLQDDGLRIYIDGQRVFDHWAIVGIGSRASGFQLQMTAGLHDFRLEFAQGHGPDELRVEWSGPGFSREILSAATVPPAPTVNMDFTCGQPGSNGWCVGDGSLSWSASIPGGGSVSGDWGDGTTFEQSPCSTCNGSYAPPDGTGTAQVSATGQGGAAQDSAVWKVDTTAPVITPVLSPDGQNGWFVTEPQVDASGSDATSGLALLQCRVDGGAWQSPPVSVTGDGSHTVDCQAVDNAGNTATWSDTVKVDTTPPASAFNAPAEGATVWGVVTLHGTSDDPVSGVAGVEVSTDGGETWQSVDVSASGAWSLDWDTRPLPDGKYTLLARAQDEAGNQEHTAVLHVTVANAPPQVSLRPRRWYFWDTAHADIQPNPYIPLKSVTVSVLGPPGYIRKWEYDAVQQVDIHWNTRWYSENGAWAHPGEYRVVVEAVDIYGHTGRAEGTVIVPLPAPTAAPTPTATATPTPTATPTSTPPPPPPAPPSPTAPLAPTATPQRVAPVAVEQPPAPPPQNHAAVLWLAAAVVVLGGVLTLDPRPREMRALHKAMQRYLEVRHD